MNHTKICLSSSEIITPFFVNCVKIADWLGSNSLAIWSLCLSSSFWILLLEPAMIFMGDFFFYQNYFDHFWQFIFLPVEIFSQRNTQKSFSFSVQCCWHVGVKRQQLDIQTRKKITYRQYVDITSKLKREKRNVSSSAFSFKLFLLAHWCEEIIFYCMYLFT